MKKRLLAPVLIAAAAMSGLALCDAYAGQGVIEAGSSRNLNQGGPGYVQDAAGAAGIAGTAGWRYWDGNWYFYSLHPDGNYGMQTGGWLWIDGYCYYFHEDGKMAAAGVTPDGYQVSDSGAWMDAGVAVYVPGKGILTQPQLAGSEAGYRPGAGTRGSGGGPGGSGSGSGGGSGGSGSGGSSSGSSGSGSSSSGGSSSGSGSLDNITGEDNDNPSAGTDTPDEESEGKPDKEPDEEPDKEADEEPEADPSLQKRLEDWQSKAREADYVITGIDNPLDRSYLVRDREANDRRLKNLVSMISDWEPHEFYMIGVDYQADTLILGQVFREQMIYSNTIVDSFNINGVSYTISRIGIQKIQNTAEDGMEEDTEDKIPSQGMHYSYGDTVKRQIDGRMYRFRCIDEDYRDAAGNYRGALFLCDTIIRSDVESSDTERSLLRFGSDNNYKKSNARKWLNEHASDSEFPENPVSIGVSEAYGGYTEPDSWEEMDAENLLSYPVDHQKMNDGMFLLSVEEAMDYAKELWRFEGSEDNNPEDQYSPWSKGYYLRTPLYKEDEAGEFCYGKGIYIVDLTEGNIHAVDVSYTTMGLRPAFVLKNG